MNKEELKELNKLFEEVKNKGEDDFDDFLHLPDGNYMAKVDDIEFTESQSGKPMVVISFEIISGEYKGTIHKQFLMLAGNNEIQLHRNLARYSTTIQKLGISVDNGLQDTFENFEKGLNKEVILKLDTTISKKTGKSFTNTSFDLR